MILTLDAGQDRRDVSRSAGVRQDRVVAAEQDGTRRRRQRRRATAPQGPPPAAAPPVEAPAPPPAAEPKPAPPRRRRPPSESGSERGLRDLVGAGRSQLGVSGALRGRDVNRPTEDDLAEAERDVVFVRRNWKPPEHG
jgi:hypothetical protein